MLILMALGLLGTVWILAVLVWKRLSVSAAIGVTIGLWALYALYEYLMYRRVLCSGECNIRVDLLIIYPMLLSVTILTAVRVTKLLWQRKRGARDETV